MQFIPCFHSDVAEIKHNFRESNKKHKFVGFLKNAEKICNIT